MRDDQLEKESLKDRILPLLFSSKTANVFRSARNVLENNDTDLDQLQEIYDSKSKDDEEFWTSVASHMSEAYNVEPPDFSEGNFRGFIKELLEIRFDKEFRKNDIKKLDDDSDLDDYLSNIDGGNNLVLENDQSNTRIILVGNRTTREYIEPLQPADEEFYPPLLIEVDRDNDELHLSGDKSQRNRYVSHATTRDDVNLQDEEPESYDELDIDLNFIHKFKSHDVFLKNIKIGGSDSEISLSVGSGDGTIEIQDFVDYDLLLQEKRDILLLSKCEFVYLTGENQEDIEFVLNFQTYKRMNSSQAFIKIALELSDGDDGVRSDIEEILKKLWN